jgi:hypothetical protein
MLTYDALCASVGQHRRQLEAEAEAAHRRRPREGRSADPVPGGPAQPVRLVAVVGEGGDRLVGHRRADADERHPDEAA